MKFQVQVLISENLLILKQTFTVSMLTKKQINLEFSMQIIVQYNFKQPLINNIFLIGIPFLTIFMSHKMCKDIVNKKCPTTNISGFTDITVIIRTLFNQKKDLSKNKDQLLSLFTSLSSTISKKTTQERSELVMMKCFIDIPLVEISLPYQIEAKHFNLENICMLLTLTMFGTTIILMKIN